MKDILLHEIESAREFLLRSLKPLEEKDSAFKPDENAYSVAGQVMHIALTISWFEEGAFGSGFTMDFEEHDKQAKACTSLADAVEKFNAAIDSFKSAVEKRSVEELSENFPENPIMNGPKYTIVYGVVDHTAHHRGSLMVYIRLLGKTPVMPYMDM